MRDALGNAVERRQSPERVRELGAIRDTEPLERLLEPQLDGVDRDAERVGDLGVRAATGRERGDLVLAARERANLGQRRDAAGGAPDRDLRRERGELAFERGA